MEAADRSSNPLRPAATSVPRAGGASHGRRTTAEEALRQPGRRQAEGIGDVGDDRPDHGRPGRRRTGAPAAGQLEGVDPPGVPLEIGAAAMVGVPERLDHDRPAVVADVDPSDEPALPPPAAGRGEGAGPPSMIRSVSRSSQLSVGAEADPSRQRLFEGDDADPGRGSAVAPGARRASAPRPGPVRTPGNVRQPVLVRWRGTNAPRPSSVRATLVVGTPRTWLMSPSGRSVEVWTCTPARPSAGTQTGRIRGTVTSTGPGRSRAVQPRRPSDGRRRRHDPGRRPGRRAVGRYEPRLPQVCPPTARARPPAVGAGWRTGRALPGAAGRG